MKNESEPFGGKVIVLVETTYKLYLVQICEKIYVKFVLPKICVYELPQIQEVLPIWPNSQNSCFKLVKVATR
ncbi:hypothetical protein PHMEG_00018425 [Phytophthora megakarya]|uniref:Uncharacterized protein n=1 Tax=Phytophthora megakarya TaxID=4795 RepID=A0A225VUE0_9STRA|nr:hypothetical protein PHMEG_00018425 [Phytophthora megakarya]